VRRSFNLYVTVLIGFIATSCVSTESVDHAPAAQATSAVQSPAQLYGPLFEAVQMGRVYKDSKTFPDAIARDDPAVIVRRYQAEKNEPGFNLAEFASRNFIVPEEGNATYQSVPGQDVCSHIDALWSVLERKPDRPNPRSSLIPLSHPYIVPGGRFREIYYWDTYFTMLGLEESGRGDMALSMVRNFSDLINRRRPEAIGEGHVPNGNRTYYDSRSQPPFLAAMVDLIAERSGDPRSVYAEFLPTLEREYSFWMSGAEDIGPNEAYRRVVRLRDGSLLNRYWDDLATPRDEAYHEDVETAKASGRPPEDVYRDLRAAAESGWDFSSRWLADGRTLATIRTTQYIPVDLNSLMVNLELTLAKASGAAGLPHKSADYAARADRRKTAIQRYLWDEGRGLYTDYLWHEGRPSDSVTAATFSPLFFGIATKSQAGRLTKLARAKLLKTDGIVTSLVETGQQWDAPNGWAPLQWIAIEGFRKYGEAGLAETIARRWMAKVINVYGETGKLMEKYNVSNPRIVTGGGEYPNQDGFGWTNGVLRKLFVIYPRAVAAPAGAGWCSSKVANDNEPLPDRQIESAAAGR
jgi:alpha,alpha-trehalase